MKDDTPLTPTESYLRNAKVYAAAVAGSLLVVAGLFIYQNYFSGPVRYRAIEDHFKYGSIGSDTSNGLPAEILRILPRLFPEYLPGGEANPVRDLTAFGFVQEPGRSLPIGFSLRRAGVASAGLNCAVCHVGVVRDSPEQQGRMILGMPSNTVDLEGFFLFLFQCAADERFTTEYIMEGLREHGPFMPPWDALLHKAAIPALRAGLLLRKDQLEEMFEAAPAYGPGRVDTFNPYKFIQFAAHYRGRTLPAEEQIGVADFPSIWNQVIREGGHMNLHWDGNNASLRERNLSAAFGAGATREDVDLASIERLERWLRDLPPPRFPVGEPDPNLAQRGQAIYRQYCFDCHDPKGARIGTVVPLERIGTSPWRLNSYTEEMVPLQKAYAEGYDWVLDHFQKTDGYANAPLDGLWARAPYLHNGSVPTLWQLLTPASQRIKTFYRGHGVLDAGELGIAANVAEVDGRASFLFDTTLPGNSNQGHSGPEYGTSLSDEEKRAVIEYVKTL